MNSSELGSLAGVTVRALRHYHQVGVLEEPPRSANGYRQYDVHDLIRVLRIKRLAALGIPLDQMPALLDEDDEHPGLLDQLDQELAAQMDRLAAQRALIAQLRQARAAPDVPPELAQFFAVHAASGLSQAMARVDRDHTVLLAHLVGADGLPELISVYERISNPEVLPAVTRLTAQFDALKDGTSEEDLETFVDEFVAVVEPLVTAFHDSTPVLDGSGAEALVGEYTRDVLNGTQQRALELVTRHLDQGD